VDADKWFWLVCAVGVALCALTSCAPEDAGLLGEALADTHRAPAVIFVEPHSGWGIPYPWSSIIMTDLSE
jgi:hypothetical protein